MRRGSSAKAGIWNHISHVAVAALTFGAVTVSCAPAANAQSTAPGSPGGPAVKIRVAGTDAQSTATPFFVAQRLGIFKEQGLDVTFVTMAGGAPSVAAALRAGEVDIAFGGASQFMDYVAKGLVPGKLIGQTVDENATTLVREGVTDVRQLKGKIFGISSYNAGDHLHSQAVLAHYGIGPNEVTWLPIGVPAARLAALVTGKVDAIELPSTSLPERAKSMVLISTDNSPIPWLSAGIFARPGFIASNKPALQKFLAAMGKGSVWARANPAEAIPLCQDSGATAELCKTAIDTVLASRSPYTWSSTSRLNTASIRAMIPILAATAPEYKNMTVTDFVDTSIAGEGP